MASPALTWISVAEVDGDAELGGIVARGIYAVAAIELVCAGAADEEIVAVAAIEVIVAGIAD